MPLKRDRGPNRLESPLNDNKNNNDNDKNGIEARVPGENQLKEVDELSIIRTRNTVLSGQVEESRQLLVRAHKELQLKNEQIQQLADENSKLLISFKDEREGRLRLEENITHATRETEELREKHITILTQKLGKDQSSSSNELVKQVKRARDELQDVYFENSRYRSEIEKLTVELTKYKTNHLDEKDEWKHKAVELLQAVQREEKNVQIAKGETEQLSNDIIRLGDDNLKLERQLAGQEEKIKIIVNHLEERNKKVDELTKMNQDLKMDLENHLKQQSNKDGELRKSNEQLRMMAEKVFQLISQLRKMEEWKTQATEDLKSAARKFQTLEKREEALQKALDKEDKTRGRLDDKVKDEREKATNFRLAAQEFRRKFIREERVCAKLMDSLKSKEKLLSQVLNKYKSVQWELQGHRNNRETRKRRVSQLEAQVNDLIGATNALRGRIKELEQLQHQMQDAIQLKEHQIINMKRREKQYVHQLKQYVDSERMATNSKMTNHQSKEIAVGGHGIDDEELQSLLTGEMGKDIGQMLTTLEITHNSFIDMSRTPALLIRKLAQRFVQIQPHTHHHPQNNNDDHLLRNALDIRSRLIGRLMKWTKLQPIVGDSEQVQAQVLKQLDGPLKNDMKYIDLSYCDIGHVEMQLVTCHFLDNPQLKVIDLRSNRIADDPFFELCTLLIHEKCYIQLVVLMNNYISKAAIKSILLQFRRYRDIRVCYFRKQIQGYVAQLVIKLEQRVVVLDLRDNAVSQDGLEELAELLASGGQSVMSHDDFVEVEAMAQRVLHIYEHLALGSNNIDLPTRSNDDITVNQSKALLRSQIRRSVPSQRHRGARRKLNPILRSSATLDVNKTNRKMVNSTLMNRHLTLTKMSKSSSTPFLTSSIYESAKQNGRSGSVAASNFNPLNALQSSEKNVRPRSRLVLDSGKELDHKQNNLMDEAVDVDVTNPEWLNQRMIELSADQISTQTRKPRPSHKIDKQSPLAQKPNILKRLNR